MTIRVPSLVATLGSLALATLALATPSSAQCFAPDGLSGPCCSPAAPTLPTAFPPVTLPALGICWDSCVPTSQNCIDLSLGPFMTTPLCTQYMVDLSVVDCAGVSLMKGTVTLDYTRTWEEHEVPGAVPTQVWRFAAKVDLVSSGVSTLGCPTPSCLAPAGQAFFYGYVDYTRNCATGAMDSVVVLYHGCDRFMHNSAFSAIPGSYHPARTYALVGPHTVFNPFTPATLAPPGGSMVTGGMRNPPTVPTEPCFVNETAIQGDFIPLIQGCLCPLGFQPPGQAGIRTAISGSCGGSATSLNLFPLTPWYELVSTSIGSWTTGVSYPGPEQAFVAEGLFLYNESCTAVGVQSYFDIFYGSITTGGWFAPGAGGLVPSQEFVDLASNYSLLTTAPIAFPLFGKVAPTDHVLFFNL
ncbi:MAG: hypothetical protein P1V81_18515 [Planctomycetota bacterium]|nr:hypothetical protein [Planctomycetota bacterium]